MSDVTPSRMKVSREGIVLIKSFEGFRPQAVARPEGGWVIGYGHTASAREGLTVGEADAELLLQYDLMPVVKALHERVQTPLNQHQFDALASFAFSLGVERFVASNVLDRINAGAADEAADALFAWPEPAGANAALRRRVAERALFVAAPEAPVTLADLLATPWPQPLPSPAPEISPQPAPPAEAVHIPAFAAPAEGARAAAVAHLLGETAPEPSDDPTSRDIEPLQVVPADAALTDADPADADPADPTPEPPAPPPALEAHLQRYSPYHAAIVGPLPALEPQRVTPAINLSPLSIVSAPADDVAVEAANDALDTPTTGEAVQADAAPAMAHELPAPAAAEPEASTVEPLVVALPAAEPFALTPLTEAEAQTTDRPLWSTQQREFGEGHGAGNEALFEDDGAVDLAPIVRSEVDEPEPRRHDWTEAGAFLLMGGTGLVSFGAAMAAFRRAAMEGSAGHQTALVGWVLLVIALICVGVSAFNLYQRWGRAQAE